jgi:hypothetical protein
MRLLDTRILFVSALALWGAPAVAWDGFGHMEVAAVAWDKLTPASRDRSIQPGPMAFRLKSGKVGFMRAATWPDIIKRLPCILMVTREIHAFWDDLLGPNDPDRGEVIAAEGDLPNADENLAAIPDENVWNGQLQGGRLEQSQRVSPLLALILQTC